MEAADPMLAATTLVVLYRTREQLANMYREKVLTSQMNYS